MRRDLRRTHARFETRSSLCRNASNMTTQEDLSIPSAAPLPGRHRARTWAWILGGTSAGVTLAGWLVMDAGWSRRGVDARDAGAVVFFVAPAMAAAAVASFVLAFVGQPAKSDAALLRRRRRGRWALISLAILTLLGALALTAMSWLTVMMPRC